MRGGKHRAMTIHVCSHAASRLNKMSAAVTENDNNRSETRWVFPNINSAKDIRVALRTKSTISSVDNQTILCSSTAIRDAFNRRCTRSITSFCFSNYAYDVVSCTPITINGSFRRVPLTDLVQAKTRHPTTQRP